MSVKLFNNLKVVFAFGMQINVSMAINEQTDIYFAHC
jgi:hypothetical protein